MATNRRLLLAASIVLAMLMLVAGLFYLDNPPGPGVEIMANDFTTDSACKALWRFESGALLVDTVGGNTLVHKGDSESDPAYEATVTTAAGTFQEGAGALSVYSDIDGYLGAVGIDDADLDAGFPLKSGDASKIISVAFWWMSTEDSYCGSSIWALFKKYHQTTSLKRTFEFGWRCSTGELGLRLWNSGSWEAIYSSGANLEIDKWYHVGLALDGVAKTYLMRLYDAVAGTSQTFSGSITNELDINDGPIGIGHAYALHYVDEVVVFNDLKTAADFDDMRDGIYAPPLVGTGLLDGKLIVYHVTDHLDGRAQVYEPDYLDGRLAINTPTEALDGLVVIRDDSTGLLDGLMDLPLMVRTSTGAWHMVPPASQWALPVAEPRRDIFVCILRATGLADYEVPMSSLQMRRRDGYPTMVSCVVPDAMTYLAGAQARVDGELIIMAGSVTADGTRHLSELDRATLESISYDHGVKSSSLSLSGYRTATTGNPRPVDLTHVSYYGLQADGKRRVRGPINQFVRPGDTAIFGAESMVVDQIFVVVEPGNAWMEVAGL